MIKRIIFESAWILKNEDLFYVENDRVLTINKTSVFYDGEIDPAHLLTLNKEDEIIQWIVNQKGAYSIIFYQADINKIFVGRDIFGRTSLVFSNTNEELIIGCSVRNSNQWHELPFAQVTSIHLESRGSHFYYMIPTLDPAFCENWKLALNNTASTSVEDKKGMIEVSSDLGKSRNEEEEVNCLFDSLVHHCSRLAGDQTDYAVAFSGGVDSLLIAYALAKAVPINTTISLINVAFGTDEKSFSCAPDRSRALSTLDHLCRAYPDHNIRLLLRNVYAHELEDKRKLYIAKAAAPCLSVLDDSLASVLWFALDGKGFNNKTGKEERSTSTVFFVGSGADEIYAGYARHRTRFQKDGHLSVTEECQSELCRLGGRNGGRDARVASQHNKRLAAPFLSDDLVEWANKLPILSKCDLSLPRGVGEKRLIRRTLAKLDAPHDSPKQAMQFGSRIAKITNESKSVKGSDISNHLSSCNNEDK